MTKEVLLTGVSGFLGSHTAIQLLNKGYKVTGTLRNASRINELQQLIGKHTPYINNLEFVEADLSDERIWQDLTRGKDFIQHIASPFPLISPKNEDDVILPAKQGTLAILKAAAKNNIKRVVLTSSSSSVLHGKARGMENGTFDETVWADENNRNDLNTYYRSKVITEKAAWAYMQRSAPQMELVTVLPGAILGPALEKDYGNSAGIILKMLDGSLPAVPRIGFDIADVRSVADLLIRAMEHPSAAGQRFLGTSGFLTMTEIAVILRSKYPTRKIPKGQLPIWFTHLLSWFDKSLQPVMLDLGKIRKADSSKARNMLSWEPISNEEAIISCAESLLSLNLIK